MKRPIVMSLLTLLLISCIVISILLIILAGFVISNPLHTQIPLINQQFLAEFLLALLM